MQIEKSTDDNKEEKYLFVVSGTAKASEKGEYDYAEVIYDVNQYSFNQLNEALSGIKSTEVSKEYLSKEKTAFTVTWESKGVWEILTEVIGKDSTTIESLTELKVLQGDENSVTLEENQSSVSTTTYVSDPTINKEAGTVEYTEKVIKYNIGDDYVTEIVRKVSVPLNKELEKNPQAVFDKEYEGTTITIESTTEYKITSAEQTKTDTSPEDEGLSME